jgi:hypothetical protein
MTAERFPVGAHLHPEPAELTLIGGIEESGQSNQKTGDVEHSRCPFPLRTTHADTALLLLQFASFVDHNRRMAVQRGAW